MPESKKQADALQLLLIEAALDFVGKPQNAESRKLLLAKLVSVWTIQHELLEVVEGSPTAPGLKRADWPDCERVCPTCPTTATQVGQHFKPVE
jgi:hypothetical protein